MTPADLQKWDIEKLGVEVGLVPARLQGLVYAGAAEEPFALFE